MSKPSLFLFVLLIIATVLTGCDGYLPTNESPQQINEPVISAVVPVLEQQIARVNNYDGASPSYIIRYEIAELQNPDLRVISGAGDLVPGEQIPPALQIQLETKIDEALSKEFGVTVDKNHGLRLENPSGTNIENIIIWKVTRVKGILEVIYSNGSAQVAFSKIASIEVYDRQSVILECGDNLAITPTIATGFLNPTKAAITPEGLCDDYSFQFSTLDVTIPDGTIMTPGQEFVKTWKIKNTGVCTWDTRYKAIFVYSSSSSPSSPLNEQMNAMPIPLTGLVAPGQEVDVSVQFKAPSTVGEYIGYWQMVNAKGIPFGTKDFMLVVNIIVTTDQSLLTITPTPESTQPNIITPSQEPNSTQTLQAAFSEIDNQFNNALKGNIAFNKTEQMKKNETTSIELILSPSLSELALATQIVDQGGFVTSTAEPSVLIAPSGEKVTVTTSQIEITPRMKAVLLPQDPEAFTVTEMHDNAEQVISSTETTAWRWSVTAKKEGSQTLELVIYQLVKYDGKEFWHEVETYKADILVEITAAEQGESILSIVSSIGAVVTVIAAILGIWKWFEDRKKKPGTMKVEIVEKKRPSKRKK